MPGAIRAAISTARRRANILSGASETELVLILGDIHANEAALMAVLNDAYTRYPVRRLPIWFLGDLFGRGPRPASAYHRLMQEKPEAFVIGNHESGLIGMYENVRFADTVSGAYNRADWDVLMLHREDLYNRGLLECRNGQVVGGKVVDEIQRWPTICAPHPSIYMVHGGLERPFEPPQYGDMDALRYRLLWEYVNEPSRAEYTLEAVKWVAAHRPDENYIALHPQGAVAPELVLVGHWHARLLYDQNSGKWHNPVLLDAPYSLDGRVVLLSPGSVGFPRENGELDASYCVLTIRNHHPFQVVFHKCAYDRGAVRDEMVRQGYPPETVKRLRLPGETETARPGAPRSRRGCTPDGKG